MSYWDDPAHHGSEQLHRRFWLAHARVREAVNRRVSGDPGTWMVDWVVARLAGESPRERALSIGCGIGILERQLVERGGFERVLGVDPAAGAIEEARRRAASAGLGARLDYRRATAAEALATERGLDAVVFHGSLHHIERVGETLDAVLGALRPGGLLILDEYVGPSMAQWTWWRLLPRTLLLRSLPRRHRRTRIVRAPRNPEDPTEMIASAEILPAVRRRFEILEERPYGGQILATLFPSLRQPGDGPSAPTAEELDRVVLRLLALEDALLARPWLPGSRTHHAVVLARAPGGSAGISAG